LFYIDGRPTGRQKHQSGAGSVIIDRYPLQRLMRPGLWLSGSYPILEPVRADLELSLCQRKTARANLSV
jgi:hypothetical protein